MIIASEEIIHSVYCIKFKCNGIPYSELQYRTIGGIIDMFIVFGSKPSDVIIEY